MKVVIYVGEGSAEYYVPEEMYARFQKELEEYHAEKKKREGKKIQQESGLLNLGQRSIALLLP